MDNVQFICAFFAGKVRKIVGNTKPSFYRVAFLQVSYSRIGNRCFYNCNLCLQGSKTLYTLLGFDLPTDDNKFDYTREVVYDWKRPGGIDHLAVKFPIIVDFNLTRNPIVSVHFRNVCFSHSSMKYISPSKAFEITCPNCGDVSIIEID